MSDVCNFPEPLHRSLPNLAHFEANLNYFVEIHGPRVLAVPKAEGFNAMVWIVPVLIFIGGIFFIALFFAKQQTKV